MIKKLLVGIMSLMLTFMFMMPVSALEENLELGPEIIEQPVRAADPPTVNTVAAGDKTISGKLKMGYNQRRQRKIDFTIYVTVNRKAGGIEEKTLNIPYTERKQDWSINLDSELEEGDKVIVKQEYGGDISEGVTFEVQKKLNKQLEDDLKMPVGEIWIEQTSSNLVSDDEQAEAIEMLKKANPDIAKDFKSVKFSIEGTDHAYYEITYTDGSKSGKIEAKNLKIKKVTEYSAMPIVKDIKVTADTITGTLSSEVAEGTKITFVKTIDGNEKDGYCREGSCATNKSVIDNEAQVTISGTTFTIKTNNDNLQFGKEFGILVKEPRKFRSCAKFEPVLVIPKKEGVRDPHNLTDEEKDNIRNAIRTANTTESGISKLPNGTGFLEDIPAVIEFDKDGNVTIISPNNMVIKWDNGKPVYQKNDDGTYKVIDESQVTKFSAKDLVKNIKPRSPEIKVDIDTGKVTITPPSYKEPGDDTDLISYTVSYNDDKGNKQSITATRDLKTNKWSGTGVDEETGVITLSVEKIEVGGTITAISKDNGGLEGDTEKLDSDIASKKLETATVSYDSNGGTGDMDGKKLNKGSKYKILDNKFTAPANEKFRTWKIGDTEYSAGDEITVKEDTSIKAIWQDIEVKVSYDANGGSGTMAGETMKKGSTYKLLANGFTAPENQKFKAWEVDGKEVAPNTEIKVDKDTVVKAIWQDIEVKVSYDSNGGSGTMAGETMKKGSTYKLLANGFTAPKNKKFKAWQVNGKEVAAGTEITVDKDIVIKAIWQDKPSNASENPGNNKDNPDKANGSSSSGPKTGDSDMIYLYASVLIMATGIIFVIGRKRRKEN